MEHKKLITRNLIQTVVFVLIISIWSYIDTRYIHILKIPITQSHMTYLTKIVILVFLSGIIITIVQIIILNIKEKDDQ
ncbi:hypothetical protein HZY83_02800 [Gemella sp. GH3]|uniref:hypothetical protein n=1 Tax=unclassified Gemella TaxID=2624949 RepID=UPI0015CF9921|nr:MULTISPECIES: hypothetical protein [unclassified Gemella]MBF0713609.1 hypothetical protein [Gemella sp. GH3.1]NYS50561.1 hypothetical protein [Gemella sp. GH3]